MKPRFPVLAALALSVSPAFAKGLASLLLGAAAPPCVLMATIGKAGATVTPLTPAQYNFARGAYVATPPASVTLPPGDRAVGIEANGQAFAALVTGEGEAAETCARFNMPIAFLKMLADVGAGVTPPAGEGL